jgi:hypothetical protein
MRGISTQSQPAARSRFAIGLAVAIIERSARRLDLIIFLPWIFIRTRPVYVLAASLAFYG